MLGATAVAHDATQQDEWRPALGREEPLNPQLRWEDPGMEEEVGDEESDHVTTLAGLLQTGHISVVRLHCSPYCSDA